MGIRRKIIIGFLGLAVLLFFSGVISIVELGRLERQTESTFDSGTANLELAREMLDAIQDQGLAMLQHNVEGNINFDSIYLVNNARFTDALNRATISVHDVHELAPIYDAYTAYDKMINQFIGQGGRENMEWFRTVYKEAHFNLASAIKDYMISSQQRMNSKIAGLGETAYRAITPGILALSVGIIILLMFLYLIDTYFSRPVVAINRSLKGYLSTRIPFNVKMEGRDEVMELKEQIEDLIAAIKNKKSE